MKYGEGDLRKPGEQPKKLTSPILSKSLQISITTFTCMNLWPSLGLTCLNHISCSVQHKCYLRINLISCKYASQLWHGRAMEGITNTMRRDLAEKTQNTTVHAWPPTLSINDRGATKTGPTTARSSPTLPSASDVVPPAAKLARSTSSPTLPMTTFSTPNQGPYDTLWSNQSHCGSRSHAAWS